MSFFLLRCSQDQRKGKRNRAGINIIEPDDLWDAAKPDAVRAQVDLGVGEGEGRGEDGSWCAKCLFWLFGRFLFVVELYSQYARHALYLIVSFPTPPLRFPSAMGGTDGALAWVSRPPPLRPSAQPCRSTSRAPGASEYLKTGVGLCVPPMCLLDYKGFRMLAQVCMLYVRSPRGRRSYRPCVAMLCIYCRMCKRVSNGIFVD